MNCILDNKSNTKKVINWLTWIVLTALSPIPYFVEHLLTMIQEFGGKYETYSKPEVLVNVII